MIGVRVMDCDTLVMSELVLPRVLPDRMTAST